MRGLNASVQNSRSLIFSLLFLSVACSGLTVNYSISQCMLVKCEEHTHGRECFNYGNVIFACFKSLANVKYELLVLLEKKITDMKAV